MSDGWIPFSCFVLRLVVLCMLAHCHCHGLLSHFSRTEPSSVLLITHPCFPTSKRLWGKRPIARHTLRNAATVFEDWFNFLCNVFIYCLRSLFHRGVAEKNKNKANIQYEIAYCVLQIGVWGWRAICTKDMTGSQLLLYRGHIWVIKCGWTSVHLVRYLPFSLFDRSIPLTFLFFFLLLLFYCWVPFDWMTPCQQKLKFMFQLLPPGVPEGM